MGQKSKSTLDKADGGNSYTPTDNWQKKPIEDKQENRNTPDTVQNKTCQTC